MKTAVSPRLRRVSPLLAMALVVMVVGSGCGGPSGDTSWQDGEAQPTRPAEFASSSSQRFDWSLPDALKPGGGIGGDGSVTNGVAFGSRPDWQPLDEQMSGNRLAVWQPAPGAMCVATVWPSSLGGAEQNVARWQRQLGGAEGETATIVTGAGTVTVFDGRGPFQDGNLGINLPSARLMAALIPLADGRHVVVKLMLPERYADDPAIEQAFAELIASFRIEGAP